MEDSDSASKSKIANLISGVVGDTDQVWTHLISPMKHNYLDESLGPPIQLWGHFTYRRKDDTFTNQRGNKCHFTVLEVDEKEKASDYSVIYLHSHGGCRLEGYPLIKQLSKYGITLVLLDFAGSGHSGGEYISMGHHEKFDVCQLISILKEKYSMKSFVLWGRSMGAATILITYPRLMNEGLLSLVLDSPFSSVKRVYRNAVKKVINLPDMVIDLIYKYAKNKIQEKYNFDLEEIRPLNVARKVIKPTAIIGTKEDKIVDYQDLEEMFANVSCMKKKLFECGGSHIDDRPDSTLVEVTEFLQKIYKKKLELANMVYVQRSGSQNHFKNMRSTSYINQTHSPNNNPNSNPSSQQTQPQGLTTFHFTQAQELDLLRGSGMRKVDGIRMLNQKSKKNYLSFRKGKKTKRKERKNKHNIRNKSNQKLRPMPMGLNLRFNQRQDQKSFADESGVRQNSMTRKSKGFLERNNSVSISKAKQHQPIFTRPPKRSLNSGLGGHNGGNQGHSNQNGVSKSRKNKKAERSISLNKMFSARGDKRVGSRARGASQRSINPPVLRQATEESPINLVQKENKFSHHLNKSGNSEYLKRFRRDKLHTDSSKSPVKNAPKPLIKNAVNPNVVLNLNSFATDKRTYKAEKGNNQKTDILKNFNFESRYEKEPKGISTNPQTNFKQTRLNRFNGERSNSIISSNFETCSRRNNGKLSYIMNREREVIAGDTSNDFSGQNHFTTSKMMGLMNPKNSSYSNPQNYHGGFYAEENKQSYNNRKNYPNLNSHSPSNKSQGYFQTINSNYLVKLSNLKNRTPKHSHNRRFMNTSTAGNRLAYEQPATGPFNHDSFIGTTNHQFNPESRKQAKNSINSLGNENSFIYDHSLQEDNIFTGRNVNNRKQF